MARQQLPPQIRKVTVQDRRTGKQVVRYEVRIDTGAGTSRRQTKRRFAKLDPAKEFLKSTQADVMRGVHVAASALTVEAACAEWLAARRVKPTTMAAYTHALQPLRDRHGELSVQLLTKTHLDTLVADLLAGKIEDRKPWAATSINPMLNLTSKMLTGLMKQGLLIRDVAALVDRVPVEHHEMKTFTENQVSALLAKCEGDRLGHAWHLALAGLRRGEIAGLRWTDIDLKANTITIRHNRVSAAGKATEQSTKTIASGRTLPLPDALKTVLKAARKIQVAERLKMGDVYQSGEHVVCNELGQPYHPDTISDMWTKKVKDASLPHIRLHDARHSCGTLMHLRGVPIAVIAAWLGHRDAAFTMRTYMHSQDDALKAAAASYDGVVSKSVIEPSG